MGHRCVKQLLLDILIKTSLVLTTIVRSKFCDMKVGKMVATPGPLKIHR